MVNEPSVFEPLKLYCIMILLFPETAQSHGGSGIQDSVLTVPLYFTPDQRKVVRYASASLFYLMAI